MFSFHLKSKFYEMFKNGIKDTEYRPLTVYWQKRITKLKDNNVIKLYYAYTNKFLIAKIISIDIVFFSELPYHAKKFFENEKYVYFFAIKLKVLEKT